MIQLRVAFAAILVFLGLQIQLFADCGKLTRQQALAKMDQPEPDIGCHPDAPEHFLWISYWHTVPGKTEREMWRNLVPTGDGQFARGKTEAKKYVQDHWFEFVTYAILTGGLRTNITEQESSTGLQTALNTIDGMRSIPDDVLTILKSLKRNQKLEASQLSTLTRLIL